MFGSEKEIKWKKIELKNSEIETQKAKSRVRDRKSTSTKSQRK